MVKKAVRRRGDQIFSSIFKGDGQEWEMRRKEQVKTPTIIYVHQVLWNRNWFYTQIRQEESFKSQKNKNTQIRVVETESLSKLFLE